MTEPADSADLDSIATRNNIFSLIYNAQLIDYEKDSGRSQRGASLSAQQTIKRELEIARFSVPN